MISIDSKEELSHYDLEGKWNDYIGVQKKRNFSFETRGIF